MGFFGDEFISGTHLLQILVFGQIINVITGPVNNLLIMTGNESEMKINTSVFEVIKLLAMVKELFR